MKLAVGITGASGAIYADLLIAQLAKYAGGLEECSLVFSSAAKQVWLHERGSFRKSDFPFAVYDKNDFSAPFASGSSGYDAMVICPCSMGTLGRVAHGTSDDLMTRGADVMLKERKKLILVARETPLSLIHIRNMATVTEAGGIIVPASPSFYSHPNTIEDACMTVVYRVLSLCGLDTDAYRWGG